jgi:hypothetical protein
LKYQGKIGQTAILPAPAAASKVVGGLFRAAADTEIPAPSQSFDSTGLRTRPPKPHFVGLLLPLIEFKVRTIDPFRTSGILLLHTRRLHIKSPL